MTNVMFIPLSAQFTPHRKHISPISPPGRTRQNRHRTQGSPQRTDSFHFSFPLFSRSFSWPWATFLFSSSFSVACLIWMSARMALTLLFHALATLFRYPALGKCLTSAEWAWIVEPIHPVLKVHKPLKEFNTFLSSWILCAVRWEGQQFNIALLAKILCRQWHIRSMVIQ